MRVVVDEGVPRQLVDALCERGIDASRFPRRWISLSNGELLRAIDASDFTVLITNDKNIADQQSLRGRELAVIALPHNRRRPILDRVDDILDTIRRSEPGAHIAIDLDGRRTIRRDRAGETIIEALPPVAAFQL